MREGVYLMRHIFSNRWTKVFLTAACFIGMAGLVFSQYHEFNGKFGKAFQWQSLWPDPLVVQQKTLVERVNINIPSEESFRILAESGDVSDEILKDFVNYADYIIASFSGPAEAYILKGYALYQRGKRPEAGDPLQKAYQMAPHFYWANYNLGMFFASYGLFERALPLLLQCQLFEMKDIVQQMGKSKMYVDVMRYDPSTVLTRVTLAQHRVFQAISFCQLAIKDRRVVLSPTYQEYVKNVFLPCFY